MKRGNKELRREENARIEKGRGSKELRREDEGRN